ncbi:MAG: hypothetical protein WBB29_09940 [Geitlerinemataceae cyanobacterium]
MITNYISVRIRQAIQNAKNLIFCALAISATGLGIVLTLPSPAMAAPLQLHPQFLATDIIQDMDRKAKSDLDTVAGAGTSDKLEGQVDKATGKAQRDLGNVKSEAKGALKQAQGKAKEDIGTTRQALENAADNAEDASDNAIDSIKDIFSR